MKGITQLLAGTCRMISKYLLRHNERANKIFFWFVGFTNLMMIEFHRWILMRMKFNQEHLGFFIRKNKINPFCEYVLRYY